VKDIDIRGGAGEFEAAVVAVIIDRIAHEESAARQRRGGRGPGLPAWVLAIRSVDPPDPRHPREIVAPEALL
jgi:hypothetical protein